MAPLPGAGILCGPGYFTSERCGVDQGSVIFPWPPFQDRGWTAVVNDDLIGSALFIAGIMVAAIGAAVGGGMSYVMYANGVGEQRAEMDSIMGLCA